MRIGRMMVVMAALLMLAATALARHRSSPSLPVVEVHGVIKNVSATEMVVTDSASHDVTVKISAETIFRSGDLALGPSTLKTGDRVEVKATVKDNVLTALLVSLEDNQNQQQEELDIR